MYFRPGPVQCTSISGNSGDNFFARVTLEDIEIEEPFAVFELSKLLNIISLFDEPSIEIEPNRKLIITDGKRRVEYVLTNPVLIPYPKKPERYKKPSDGIEFNLTTSDMKEIYKASAVLKTTFITFGGDGQQLFISTSDYNNPVNSNHKIFLGPSEDIFSAVIEKDYLKIIDTDYNVTVAKKGFIYFSNGEIEYFIPVNAAHSNLGN
jgi:hypothetical protein